MPEGTASEVHLAHRAAGAAAAGDVGATRRTRTWDWASLEGLNVLDSSLFDLHHELSVISFHWVIMENSACLVLLNVDGQAEEEEEKRDHGAHEPHGLICT